MLVDREVLISKPLCHHVEFTLRSHSVRSGASLTRFTLAGIRGAHFGESLPSVLPRLIGQLTPIVYHAG